MTLKVSVIGLGNMGRHYVARLLDAGHAVTVWNRTAGKIAPVVAAGAAPAVTAAQAIAASPIVIAALEHADAFETTLLSAQALEAFTPRHLVIDMSTVSPQAARRSADILSKQSVRYLDCPVSGGTRGAAAGTLTLLIGGAAEDVARAGSLLCALGKLHHVGAVGAGQTAKLVNQVIVAGTIAAVAEGLVLAERAGLDGPTVAGALQGGFGDSRVLREHGERMLRRDFGAGATNRVFLKDLDAIHAMADSLGLDLPIANSVRAGYQALVDSGHAEEDHSSFWLHVERHAGRRGSP